jgi:ribosomal-protein-alanine N-acetyltransferase
MSASASDYVSTQVGSDYVFATAVPNDASQMKKLNEACLPENYPYRFWFDLLSMNPNISFVCRSTSERRMVGYALFGKDSKDQMRLISVAVLPTHRRKGIAERLIHRGLEKIGSTACHLDVRVSNEGAIRLYERLGFQKVRIFPAYYANSEDSWVMVRAADTTVEALVNAATTVTASEAAAKDESAPPPLLPVA